MYKYCLMLDQIIIIGGVIILSCVAIYYIWVVKRLKQELIEQPEPDIVLAEEITLANNEV